MDRKWTLIFGLCTLMSIISYQSQAACCRRPICYFPPVSNMQAYVDLSFGRAFNSKQLNYDGFSLNLTDENPPPTIVLNLTSQSRSFQNNVMMGTGLVMKPQSYLNNSNYFPFISYGLQYRYTNFDHQKTLTELNAKIFNYIGGEKNLLADFSSIVNYDLSQQSLLANLKLDIYQWRHVMPYISVGLGVSRNQASQKEPFLIPTDLADGDDTFAVVTTSKNTSFSYSLGAGLDFIITNNLWLTLGYEYNDFGHLKLKPSYLYDETDPGDFVETTLKKSNKIFSLHNLNTQTIQLTGRYLFG